MKVSFRSIGAGLLASTLLAGAAQADVIAVGHQNLFDGSGSLFIFGAPGVSGTATSGFGFNEAFVIPGSGVVEIDVPIDNYITLTENDTVVNKAIFIDSADPISAHFLNRAQVSSDMTYLHDVESLGTDYRILGFSGRFGEGAQFSVTATTDNTVVTITPTAELLGRLGQAGHPAGVPIIRELQAGESIKFRGHFNSTDPSGTKITSTHPIAVFSGAACTQVPNGTGTCDHIVSQLPSTDNFDNHWIIPETANQGTAGNVVRIVADQDDTQVVVNGVAVATLNAGEVHTIANAHDLEITTSKDALVGQYLRGADGTGQLGDPAFTFVPGVNQLLDEYVFSTPVATEVFAQNFLAVAVMTSDLASLLLNGVLVNPLDFTLFGATGWSVANLAVAPGAGIISADNPFFASIAGFAIDDSYLTIIGATFTPGASPTPGASSPPSPPPPPPPSSVPEPDILALFGVGLAGLGMVRLRRRRGRLA